MLTLSLIAFCLGIFALGYYCIAHVVAELRASGPAGVAYAYEALVHPKVIAAL